MDIFQQKQVEAFKKNLEENNQKINLFSRKNPDQLDLLLEETLKSSSFLRPVFAGFDGEILDIGSGNGLPGIVCAILYPKNQFVLCERNRKKSEFLKAVAFQIKTLNVRVLCEDAQNTGLFKKVLSQATGPIEDVLNILNQVLTSSNGEAFLWKSSAWEQSWPKTTSFFPQVFKKYESQGAKRVLLKVTRLKQKNP
ncbi:MAG: 16S rRNA (guanine(527)-N(7))-methyltransferase RsmG [Bdellovibrionales bacterium]